jgi:hypothetical protein
MFSFNVESRRANKVYDLPDHDPDFVYKIDNTRLLSYWMRLNGPMLIFTVSGVYVDYTARGILLIHTTSYKLAVLSKEQNNSTAPVYFALDNHCVAYKSMFLGRTLTGSLSKD